MKNVRVPERHEVKHRRSAPQPGPRNLKQEYRIGMSLLTACNTWSGLGGFGHLPQYTANKSGPASSNNRHVMKGFAHFKLFTTSKYVKDIPADAESVRSLDEAK